MVGEVIVPGQNTAVTQDSYVALGFFCSDVSTKATPGYHPMDQLTAE
jgi:hypothetical protein